MWKFLPVLFLVALIAVAGTFLPLKRTIVYKLGISGDTPISSCCNTQAIASSNGNFDENANLAEFDGQVVDYPKTSLAQMINDISPQTQVLGTTNAAGEEKWIEVVLDTQSVRAWEGNKLVMEFPISSGLWFPTPKGTFNIWYKTRFQTMKGGSKALGTYYYLPNVPYNMFFYSGYALHGAYWHNNFGHPMSHGCVNEPIANSKAIFDWAGPVLADNQNAIKASPENPGTRVYVH